MAVEIQGACKAGDEKILTRDALAFLAKLHHAFNDRRLQLLKERTIRQAKIDAGAIPDFLPETKHIREDLSWNVRPVPKDLEKRYVEITGPTEKKMMINALNSGADAFMADFEDALSPTWENVVEGQKNLIDAVLGTLSFTSPEGKQYALHEKTATLIVRPRGWHLDESHCLIEGKPISASLFDFALFFFHNVKALLKKGTGPYFYLPKLESHLEARLWNDIFIMAQQELHIPRGTIKATVLVETILGAFEMEEILYELQEHCVGMNAGRWDYIFSVIKKFRKYDWAVLPDRAQVTMTVPFMRSYTDLLIATCHKRGAHAMGGMAAFIPSRKNAEVNATALQKVTDDKVRESQDGFDGTWVAHPDLVPVARDVFVRFLHDRPHQKERLREEVEVSSQKLLDFRVPGGTITEESVRHNIAVSIYYVESWLRGQGALALFNLMEDAATAEISRAQLWQWIHQKGVKLVDGSHLDIKRFRTLASEELQKIRSNYSAEAYAASKFELAHTIIDKLVTSDHFEEFLTLAAYQYLGTL